ncbi:hypothetical protein FQR65_LT02581 [Abscondita terminalis]|nr:hypothetical protein FQR65_LT02581 [Abscondita terminalis]
MTSKLIIILSFASYVSSARILGISPSPSHSHQVVFQQIWKELSLRGHELVVLTADPINNSSLTNLTEIDLHNISYDIWNRDLKNIINAHEDSVIQSMLKLVTTKFEIADAQFQDEQVRALINNQTERFDLVMVEYLLPIYYVFAAHFDCPFIGITSMDAPPISFNFVGNPNHPAITPDNQFYYDEKLTLFQRVRSTFISIFTGLLFDILFKAHQQEIVSKHFKKEMPHVHEIAENVSLLFLNTEPIFHPIRSLVPSVIQIGGKIQKGEGKPLEKELKERLDQATNGFIYFSLGSNVKSKDLPPEKQKIILETFSEVPYLVLWKFELDNLPNKPKNVITFKWVSQESVLKHPNIKLFVTQGGLQSMEEAVFNFVPMVGIPFFSDQFQNVRKMVAKGMGLSVDHQSLNKNDLKTKMLEVIENSKYKEKVIEIGTLIQDQPMTGLEKVVWWTEYVLRHKGARHLRSPFLDVPEYTFTTMSKLLIVLSLASYVTSARILGISPSPSVSHQVVLQPIWQELSLRGHELVVLTADPINNSSLTNLTEIDVHDISYNIWNRELTNIITARENSVILSIIKMTTTTFEIADAQFQHEQVRALINNETEHFDLVIVEFLLPIYYIYAAHFNCPFIGITTMDPPPFAFNYVGNLNHPAITSDGQFHYDEKLTFFQRVRSTFTTVFAELTMDFLFRKQQQEVISKHFKKEMPHVHEIARNVSLVFLNTEPIFHPIRSLVPSVIQIGGKIHRSKGKPLGKDLREKLDKATNGFIYFSLGSNVKSKDLSAEKQQLILETFAELPFLVLWKFELDNLPNKPKNVITYKWLSQESVLKHPNIKLFITQGGLQSLEEAVFSFVPMIGMPFFSDQFQNVRKIVAKGMGLSIDYKTLNKDDFKRKIMEVIENAKYGYKEKVTEIGTLIQDQPMTGLEKVVWWTEYVLRHKGAKHLRSPFLDVPIYQLLLLDVLFVVVVSIILLLTTIRVVIKCVRRLMSALKDQYTTSNILEWNMDSQQNKEDQLNDTLEDSNDDNTGDTVHSKSNASRSYSSSEDIIGVGRIE